MSKRLIVIDVSNFIFRAFFAIRVLHTPEGAPVNAVHGVLAMFLKLFSKHRPTHILLAKDTKGGCFRNKLFPEYKANRSEPPEDLVPQFDLIQTLIEKMGLSYLENSEYEADDIIGTICTKWKDHFDEILIASGDKDLMQFVGGNVKMLDTMKDKTYDAAGVFEKMGVYPEQIVDYLSMVGDSSDNIPGMRGIGAKGAAKLLAEHSTLEKCIELKDTFKGKKLTTAFSDFLEDGLLSKKLIKIVTDIEIDMTPEACEFKFYPSDELIHWLKSLGFKSAIVKLQEIQRGEFYAAGNEQEGAAETNMESLKLEVEHKKFELDNLLSKIIEEKKISLIVETDQAIAQRIIRIVLCLPDGSVHITAEGESESNLVEITQKLVEIENLEIINESTKELLTILKENKIEASCSFFDIRQAHFIINPDLKHTLDFMGHEYLGVLIASEKEFVTRLKKDLDVEIINTFFAQRVFVLSRLQDSLKEKMSAMKLKNVYDEIDAPLFDVLSDMERAGVSVNVNYLHDLAIELAKELTNIEMEILAFTKKDDLNLNSPKQVAEFLFEELALPVVKKTKTGYSTDVEVLEELESKKLHQAPALIIKFRELGKLLSTYVNSLPNLVDSKSQKIHTSYNQSIAATGRLSSTNPNLQNIPIRTENGKKIRAAFIASSGNVLFGADYSQVELRLLAHLSQDPVMLSAFKNGIDIHTQTASEIMGINVKDITSSERSKAKAVNFGLMYGQSSFGLAKQLNISRKEAKEYITRYFERFSHVKTYLDSLKELAESCGFSETMFGRKRLLPNIHSKNRNIKAMAERVAINSPIQGSASDIIKLAMIKIHREFKEKKLQTKMILQVHDELIFDVPEAELKEIKEIVVRNMENVVSLSIPLSVESGIGANWLSLK